MFSLRVSRMCVCVLVCTAITACSSPSTPSAHPHPYDTVRLGLADYADATSTALALSKDNIKEANPILAPFGDAAPLVAIPLKYGAKHAVVALGSTPAQANVAVESFSWMGACANIATILGAAPPLAIGTGLVCAATSGTVMQRTYVHDTGRHLNGTPALR